MPKKKKIIIIASSLVLIAAAVGAYLFMKPDAQTASKQPAEPPRSQLTGLEASKEESERPILAVMIENSEASRPQTGLDGAGIVFEAITEGGITRFLALYQTDTPETVGPIRSVRTHFLDWMMGFDASLAHVGGSPEALEAIKTRDAKDLDETANESSYYRDDTKDAPHDAFAKTEELRKLQAKLGHSRSQFDAIPRKADSPAQTPAASTVSIDYVQTAFQVEFRYDKATNSYVRYLAGEPHVDAATGKPITVKNVVVLIAETLDNDVQAIGDGAALVFTDGAVRQATWEQKDYSSRLKIFNAPDETAAAADTAEPTEAKLNRGDTWISAVRFNGAVTYK